MLGDQTNLKNRLFRFLVYVVLGFTAAFLYRYLKK